MFDSLKVIHECKKLLKKHNINFNEEFRIYKKLGMIHCKINDWRGQIEVDGFPVITIKSAVLLLVESCAFDYFLLEEKNKREQLIKEYPLGYGEYETRKYLFECILKVIKDYDEKNYKQLIKKYTKFLNMNIKTKQKWLFNKETEKFELYPTCNYSAVIISKASNTIRIYNQEPCGGRLDDNIYKLISEDFEKGLYKFSFTNDGEDRFYLEVYNPQYTDGSDNYIMINKADRVVWSYVPYEKNFDNPQIRTFVFDGTYLKVIGDINFSDTAERKYPIFITAVEREGQGTGFIELQYCRRKMPKKIALNFIKNWKKDSLYIGIESLNIFTDQYFDIFSAVNKIDLFSPEYFTNKQVKQLRELLLERKPLDYKILVNWLDICIEKGYSMYFLGV